MFVDRERDLVDLDDVLSRPGAQLMIVSGRRRVGKTTLLLEWAHRSEKPFLYWVASRSPAAILLQTLSRAIYSFSNPGEENISSTFSYSSWSDAFHKIAELAAERRLIVILDEVPYAIESDHALTSLLQNAWDQHLQHSQVFLVLAGSHISLMSKLQTYRAPLYGRFTAQLRVDPLPFHAIHSFLPRYDAEKRVAVYAILGGIPAYLEQFDDRYSLRENLERTVFRRTGIFRTEPFVLIGDLVREPRNFAAVIRAIAADQHTPDEIAAKSAVLPGNVHKYLSRLVELQLVERRVPATVPARQRTTNSRYYLADPFLRFYYRFLEPHQEKIEQELKEALWQAVSSQLRAFIGTTTFEELCREWMLGQARASQLPFAPETISGFWGSHAQVDVVALSWSEKAILLAECKWTAEPMSRSVIAELVDEKTPRVLAELPESGRNWKVYYTLFSRSGFTSAAATFAAQYQATRVDLPQLDRDLGRSTRP